MLARDLLSNESFLFSLRDLSPRTNSRYFGTPQKARLSGRVSEIFRESFSGPVRGPGLDAFWLPVKGRRTQGPRTWCFAWAKQPLADDCLWGQLVGARNR